LPGFAIVAAMALAWFAGSSREHKAPRFTRLTFRTGNVGECPFLADGKSAVFDAQWDGAPPEVFQVPFDFPPARPARSRHSGTAGRLAPRTSWRSPGASPRRPTSATAGCSSA